MVVFACFLVAPEEAAHWKWHCDNSFPRAWSTTIQPEKHPISLSACFCHCPGSQPLHWECLLQVGIELQWLSGWWVMVVQLPSPALHSGVRGKSVTVIFISALCAQLAKFTWWCNWWCWRSLGLWLDTCPFHLHLLLRCCPSSMPSGHQLTSYSCC